MSFFQDGLSWFASQQKAHCSRAVIYKRGVNQVEVQAVDGASELEHDDGSGVLDKYEVRDYLINVADLEINNVAITPQRGDQIIDGASTYTVDAPDGMSVCQDDANGLRWIVHTWVRNADL
jgi:hypothetical protein